jgi:hypothetical protein
MADESNKRPPRRALVEKTKKRPPKRIWIVRRYGDKLWEGHVGTTRSRPALGWIRSPRRAIWAAARCGSASTRATRTPRSAKTSPTPSDRAKASCCGGFTSIVPISWWTRSPGLRAWHVHGRQGEARPWASFNGWVSTIARCVARLGMPDPGEGRATADATLDVGCRALAIIYEVIDRLSKRRALIERSSVPGVTSGDLVRAAFSDGHEAATGEDDLADAIEPSRPTAATAKLGIRDHARAYEGMSFMSFSSFIRPPPLGGDHAIADGAIRLRLQR